MSRSTAPTQVDDLIYHYNTPYAWCVSTEEDTFGNEAERIYLPKSLVTMEKSGEKGLHVFTMPEWLAIEKGLV